MNERIKELLDESGLLKYTKIVVPEYEMFAKLIVQECAEFARLHNLRHADRSHMIHKAIKEEFGVKE